MHVADLCSALVKIQSENPPGDTRDVIEFLREYTTSIGLATKVIRRSGGRHNLVSAPPRGRLLFCGHVDCVPALPQGWSVDPYGGIIRDGKVFGRGSTDMKGGCAAILAACTEWVDAGQDLPADIAFVCDEETSGTYGVKTILAKRAIKPCDCIIAEPTPPLSPNVGQKGIMRLCCTFHGEPGHGSLYPRKGVSAIMEAFAFLEYVRDLHGVTFDPGDPQLERAIRESSVVLGDFLGMEDTLDVLTRIMYNPGTIEGGEKANIVAQQCRLELDLRIPWGCELSNLLEDLKAHAPRGEIAVTNMSAPSITPTRAPLVQKLLQEIENVHGRKAHPIVQWAASDARYLRQAGFPVVEYGPGEIRTLHAIDEYVTVESLENAVKVYRGMLARYAEVSQEQGGKSPH
ncbi:MAG: ArgE/DapE family deacylase [Methanolinea sp.]|nr:ArgE/DapE family deacylase [Methanolinea sp.]